MKAGVKGTILTAVVQLSLIVHLSHAARMDDGTSVPITLPKTDQPAELINHMPLLQDTLGTFSTKDILNGVHDDLFQVHRFDGRTNIYWGLFRVKVDEPGNFYFSTVHAFDTVAAYVLDESKIDSGGVTLPLNMTGYQIPLRNRLKPKAYAQAVLPIRFSAPGTYKVYLKFAAYDPFLSRLRNLEKPQLYSERGFDKFINDAYLIGGLYLGIAALAFFINFVWFLETRKKLNFLFICFVSCGFIYKIATSGYTTEWFFPDDPLYTGWLRQIFPPLTTMFYVLFCLRYIQCKERFPKSYKIIMVLLVLYTISTPMIHALGQFMEVPVFMISLLSNVVVAYLSVVVVLSFLEYKREGVPQQLFFTLGVLVYFVGIIAFYIHYVLQLYPGSYFFKFYFSIISSVREVLLFLATAYGFMRSEKLLAIENEVNKRITKQKEELTLLNAKNQKILSLITHDLRNPLFNLECLLDMFKAKKISEEEFKTLVGELDNAVEGTTNLFENILLWAKGQQLTLTPKLETLHIDEMVNETETLMLPIAESKGIRIDTNYPVDTKVQADSEMLKSVLRNLLSNAIKFSNPGEEVRLSVEKRDKALQFIVKDKGVGMTEEVRAKLFELDKKSEKGTGNESGTGLGLILTREFLEKHGSSLHVDSTPGQGSKFSFELPEIAQI